MTGGARGSGAGYREDWRGPSKRFPRARPDRRTTIAADSCGERAACCQERADKECSCFLRNNTGPNEFPARVSANWANIRARPCRKGQTPLLAISVPEKLTPRIACGQPAVRHGLEETFDSAHLGGAGARLGRVTWI